jgi:hypothetical protein
MASTTGPTSHLQQLTAAICEEFQAQASGFWMVEGDRLIQAAFVGHRLDPGVAHDFAEATRTVPIDRNSRLGIVGAAVTGQPTVSRISELPPDVGSGRWLRAFNAVRSIAVPLGISTVEASPNCRGVLAVALSADSPLEDAAVIRQLVAHSEEFLGRA